jgi:hypothetical protein
LIWWALGIWDDIKGRMIMNGVDYMALETGDMLSLFYSCIVDDAIAMGSSRQEVRDIVDKKLEDLSFTFTARMYAASKTDVAGNPVYVAKPEPKPFELTAEMQQAFGLHPPTSPQSGDG